LRSIALTALGYLAALTLLTWPLAAHLGTQLPRTMGYLAADTVYTGWVLAWQTHALTTAPSQFANANMYWPAPSALFYSTPGFGLLPTYAPLFLATGNPTLALNGTMLVNLALTATALHLVIRRWTGSPAAAIAAACTYLLSPLALWNSGYMQQYTALAAMPVIVSMVATGGLTWPRTLGLAALIALQGTADAFYVNGPLFLTLGLAALMMRLRPSTCRTGGRLLVALGVAAVALTPIYAGYLSVSLANPNLRQQSFWPAGLTQTVQFALRGLFPRRGPLTIDAAVLLPVIAGLAVAAVRGERDGRWHLWAHSGCWFVVGLALAWLVPVWLPGFRDRVLTQIVRDPTRLGFGGAIGLCLLVGLGFAACASALAAKVPPRFRRLVAPALLVVFLATRVAHSPPRPGRYPLAAAPRSGAEADVLRRGTGPVLELPLGAPQFRTTIHATAMYRSVDHWRPLLNGYCGYYPRGFLERMALAEQLPDRDALDRLRSTTGLTTIVVRANGFPNISFGPWVRAFADGQLPGVRIIHRDSEALVLDVELAKPSRQEVPGDRQDLHLGRAAAQLDELRVARESFDDVFFHVAVAGQDVDRLERHERPHFGAVELPGAHVGDRFP